MGLLPPNAAPDAPECELCLWPLRGKCGYVQWDNPAISDLRVALTLYDGLDRVDWEVVIGCLPGERNRFALALPTPFHLPRVTCGVPFAANEIANACPIQARLAPTTPRYYEQGMLDQTCLVQNWGEHGL